MRLDGIGLDQAGMGLVVSWIGLDWKCLAAVLVGLYRVRWDRWVEFGRTIAGVVIGHSGDGNSTVRYVCHDIPHRT